MVRLRQQLLDDLVVDDGVFTIHYGEIKTYDESLLKNTALVFTIHYGEIKTHAGTIHEKTYLDLQSTMVRLRRLCYA